MKAFCFLFTLCLSTYCAFAQLGLTNYEWKATMRVVDELGNPISGVTATIGYFTNSQPATTLGITDTNGAFSTSQALPVSRAEVGLQADMPGYYTTSAERELGPQYDPDQWTFTQTLVLKKVGKPIAMYAKKYAMALKLPEYGKPIAYDLEIGDWVGPYGKGVNKDIIFQKEYSDKGAEGYYSKATVSFPKDGDGIQVYTIPETEKGSGLRSPHEAPLDGYQPEVTRETSALRGQPSKFEFDPNRIYLFRVRTVKDHEGNIVSAHYGKIYGDFMQFTYYLNPTPNDRNIEFDPKQNLLQGLQSFEQVNQP
jgi:hypothetical protein